MIKDVALTLAAFLHFDKILYDLKRRKNYSTILSLHRVSDEVDYFWPPIKTETFRKLLEYCSKNYSVSSLSDLLDRKKGKPKLVLSFDDGYADFVENALPELVRFGVPSNHNIVIKCVEKSAMIWTQEVNMILSSLKKDNFRGALMINNKIVRFNAHHTKWREIHQAVYMALLKKSRKERDQAINEWRKIVSIPSSASMMNWEQIKKCLKNGVEIGSHTVTHQTLSTLNDMTELHHEVSFSKKVIEEKLQIECRTLAVPNGQYNKAVLTAGREAGYERVLLVGDLCFRPTVNQDSSFLTIPRINMIEESESRMQLRVAGVNQFVKHGRL